MKSALIVGAVVGISVLVAASLLHAQATPPAPLAAPSSMPGRYQITSVPPIIIPQQLNVPSEIWMVDTQTGDVWGRVNGGWSNYGNPAKDPGLH